MEKDKIVFKKTNVFSNAYVEVMITEDKTIDKIRQKLTEQEINYSEYHK